MKKVYVCAETTACEIKGQTWVCGPQNTGSRGVAGDNEGTDKSPLRKLYV